MAKKPESKDLRKLRALIEKRADKVMDLARPGFNAADILGITLTPPSNPPTDDKPGTAEAVPGVAQAIPGSQTATPGLAEAVPGVAQATKVVVNINKNTTTMVAQTTPGLAEAVPGVAQAIPGSQTATPGDSVSGSLDQPGALGRQKSRRAALIESNDDNGGLISQTATPGLAEAVPGVAQAIPGSQTATPGCETAILAIAQPKINSEDILAAWRFGSTLSAKGIDVLRTLDRYRSVTNPAYTVPIGYAKLAEKAAVGLDYLRHSVLPGLALRGLIAVASKGFSGTVYQILCDRRIIELIASGATQLQEAEAPFNGTVDAPLQPDPVQTLSSLPEWVDRQNWGTLAPDTVRHLIEKAGSEEQAREVLEIIVYNETHGPEKTRVRNRLSVLSRYLNSPNVQIWPADDGYETISLRNARLERDRALKEKALAEEALKARQEERKLRFLSSLTDSQMSWIKHEAKNTVDHSPGSRQGFIKSATRLAHYKAEEEKLIAEWQERSAYGEVVPSLDGEGQRGTES